MVATEDERSKFPDFSLTKGAMLVRSMGGSRRPWSPKGNISGSKQ